MATADGSYIGEPATPNLSERSTRYLRNLVDKVIDGPMCLRELIEIFRREHRFVADFQTRHRQGPACLKHELRSFGIIKDVGFGGGVYVAPGD